MIQADVRLKSFAVTAAVVIGMATSARRPGHLEPDQSVAPSPAMLLPGSSLLTPPAFGDTSGRLSVLIKRATGDTAERQMAENRRGQSGVVGQPDKILFTSVWMPPFASNDSLVVERKGLVPVSERLDFRGIRTYRYSQNRVTGTVQLPDSAPRPFDKTFPQPVFAFNEVDILVRSLPFRPGLMLVVPLFSESDEALELDTLTVIGPDSAAAGKSGWVVRFADPAIVTRYVIATRSRAILSTETTQRRSGARLRYVDAPQYHHKGHPHRFDAIAAINESTATPRSG